ncbi:hydroxysqualene dehydroxylase [Microvirga pudoricolor]|uniref:hydroxysqualene dehydroxylase n=1 Tax=Microvirga pudoricolor TaxID=2778729 RepID=UPI00194DB42B|nr:FAD-dependent oxidoreductase [Microvirga pudoricolor]MBM6593477.1 FAD-dependent oxidoreductase [Microvirga pudoricolor]
MTGRTHIIGAGVAGLSAALAASSEGRETILYEAAPQAGGRCRTLDPADGFRHDNGTHVLFTANRCALDLIETVGARHQWIEPEPEGLPLLDARTGRLSHVGLTPWSWLDRARRPAGLSLEDLGRIARLAFSSDDRPVSEVVGKTPILDTLIEPLTVAVLNTPVATASSRRLGRAMRSLLSPGAGHLLVARNGLSEDLVQPALWALEDRGATILTGQRLTSIRTRGDQVAALVTTDRMVVLRPDDQVVLALPPWEIARLVPHLSVPDAFEPILNLHFRMRGLDRPRFVGLIGTLAQWVLVRADHVSVTVSAADAAMSRPAASLSAAIWREIVPALQAVGLDVAPDRQPEARIVKEKRATIRQAAGPIPQPLLRPFANMALAGDWIGDFPATIESAVMAGERAAALLGRPRVRGCAPRAGDAARTGQTA